MEVKFSIYLNRRVFVLHGPKDVGAIEVRLDFQPVTKTISEMCTFSSRRYAHRDDQDHYCPVCGYGVFWIQIAFESLALHLHDVLIIYTSLRFTDKVENPVCGPNIYF